MVLKIKKSDIPLLTKRYDLAGNSILRTFRHQLLAKFIPLGNYQGGAGIRCLLTLSVLHYFGGILFHFLIRFERQAAALYRIRERVKFRRKG